MVFLTDSQSVLDVIACHVECTLRDNFVFHVSSMESVLAFRADGPGFEPRSGMARHIQSSVD